MSATDPARWFDAVGQCRCSRAATGVLRGTRNESLGPYCSACANARIRKADRDRAAAAVHAATTRPRPEDP